jgi:hypothetical protein
VDNQRADVEEPKVVEKQEVARKAMKNTNQEE